MIQNKYKKWSNLALRLAPFLFKYIYKYYFSSTKASATLNIGPAPAVITKSLF